MQIPLKQKGKEVGVISVIEVGGFCDPTLVWEINPLKQILETWIGV